MSLTEMERAKIILKTVAPGHRAETSCMLVAAAIAGMRGLTMRHIKIGSLFWPKKFADDPYLSMRGGWGCEGYDVRNNSLYLSEPTIAEDGGFNGHTWLEPEADYIVDLMHDNEGSGRHIYDKNFHLEANYIPRPKLERAVKQYWKVQMRAAMALGAVARLKVKT